MEKLLNIRLLDSLSHEERQAVLNTVRIQTHEHGQMLFMAGDPATCVYFLLEGMVKVTFNNLRGDEALITLYQVGDVFGELFLGRYRFRVGTAQALNTVRVAAITEDDLIEVFTRFPSLSLRFIGHLADRNRQTLARMHTLMHVDAEARLIGTLLNLSRHYCCTDATWFSVPDGLTQADLAQMSCLNRSTVSSLINQLRRRGILGGSGRSLQVNIQALHQIADASGLDFLE